ncbi:MAG: sensor signal transduction histidine kinase [Polyangiaceae bacterium]|jgi:sigma-B regulation protein RsbU (phosphoserine phosphatase)|nr:sensor signal transduction histidine kinase [Polyangiaceae bacterium]
MLSAEEQALLDTAACGLMRTLPNGTFLRVNETFANWVGYRPSELVQRRRFQDLLTVGGRIFHQTHWVPLLQIQGSISEVKLELVHRGGQRLPMVINAICRPEGVHDLAAFVARDRDTYEKELLASRKRLEQLVEELATLHDQAKDRALFAEQMMGIVSHDLRNPISTIRMGAALLGRTAPAAAKVVERLSRASDRADRLITDLLDFTRARLGGGLTASLACVDLHALVATAVEDHRLTRPDRLVQHRALGSGDCDADSHRLEQLIGNLVSNAAAYGDPDKPITVESSVQADSFSVAVHNYGSPIPEELRERLFQPMTRGAHTGSSRSVGLGLFIVEAIAKAHGGRVELTSSAEAGTTFRATFPRRKG